MATRRKKKVKLKFEVSRGAVSGIAVVLFCLFLWTFIFGVWAGQSWLSGRVFTGEADGRHSTMNLSKMQIIDEVSTANEKETPPYIRVENKAIKKGK
ncbi:hypothetical protein JWG39_08655 [Desulforhopalus vacuolatus]|uniref:hypothetical protein n=1 Tax=Desulforhopalus vacuolatus TaxID=40414 RepID=UPI001966AD25|nr:hypothetical protein [Desulforhopalus vacuolatus]MBM9519885.1 hypothetical protein [Desulforhopalus vacuolatus]